jgi:Ca2+-binding RTX toxin-like protein
MSKRLTRIKFTVLAALGAAVFACAPAHAALPQLSGSFDLASPAPNAVVDGSALSDGAAQQVADAGDVNGDGIEDALVGAPYVDPNGRRDAGTAYVVFGRTDGASIDLAKIPAGGGFRINGAVQLDHLGWSVAGAGDVNGDGLADVVVGAKDADNRGRNAAGSAYVIFGRRSTAAVDTLNLGSNGFRIDGATAGDQLGSSVAGGRDLNGDGRPDVLVGAPQADRNGRVNSGSVFVVLGTGSAAGVDAAALGAAGYAIDGAAAGDQLGGAVAATSDFSGDGRADALVGAPFADPTGRTDAGAAYVVPGQATLTPIDLAVPGAAGYVAQGAAAGDGAGSALAQGGDLDGNGLPDLLVGAPGADNNGRPGSGSAYVLLAAAAGGTHNLGALDATWRIDGAAAGDAAGTSVGGGRDLNADGRADLVVGSPYADSRGRTDNGSVRVFYGGGFGGLVDLASTAAPGFRADGSASFDNAGNTVALSADSNADGWPDLLAGAWRSDHLRRGDSGSMYYLWGSGPSNLEYPDGAATTVGQAISPLAPEAIQRTGVVSFSVTPALPSGLTLDAHTGVISGSPSIIAEQPSTYTLTMTDYAHAVSVPLTLRIAPLPGACANTRDGGGAADKITGTSGGDKIDAGAGDDAVDGLSGDDCELGDDGADNLSGGDGNDQLHGGLDHDTLSGGGGSDQLYGDAGQDDIAAGAGADLVYGGAGFDEIDAGDGNDRVFGDGDSDVISGGAGNDRLDGGAMADKLVGGAGNDVLIGGAGNDIILDTSGSNRVDAGSGSDSINVRNGARDVVRCGAGRDVVRADRGDRLIGCEKVIRSGAAKKKPKKRR